MAHDNDAIYRNITIGACITKTVASTATNIYYNTNTDTNTNTADTNNNNNRNNSKCN